MRKIARTNLNNRLSSKNKNSQKERSSKDLFSQRRLLNLGLRGKLTQTTEFVDREGLSDSLVQIGVVAGFRGIRGDTYVRATKPVRELFSSRCIDPLLFDRLAVFFKLENKFFEAVVSKFRSGSQGFYLMLEGLNTRTKVGNLRFSEVLIHKESVLGILISQIDSYVGFMVLNVKGKQLGTILEVGGTRHQTYLKTSTTIIPNVSGIVVEVKKESKTVLVDWSDSW
jgi:ribosomal 30S subunit maturation factor RimM